MSDYEMLNRKIAAQKAVRRKDMLWRLFSLLVVTLAAVLAISGLERIGFISCLFAVILVACTVCAASFHAGRIFAGYRR